MDLALKDKRVIVTGGASHKPGFFLDYEPEIWPKVLDVNLQSCMSCVRALLPSMMEQRSGAIVATTSMAAFGEARQSVYAASDRARQVTGQTVSVAGGFGGH